MNSIFVYPWDLAAEGVHEVLTRVRERAGVNGIRAAVSYHAAELLLPHNPHHRVWFPEDGAIYFEPRHAFPAIWPRIANLAQERVLEAARDEARSTGLHYTAWMVCLHNTWLGTAYPQYAVRNVFGNLYPFSLCPTRPEVRDYLCTLLDQVLRRFQPDAVEFESPGFLPFKHGFDRGIQVVSLNPVLLLSLCFCEACAAPESVASGVRSALEQFFREGTMEDVPGLPAFLESRNATVAPLLQRLMGMCRDCGAEATLISFPKLRDEACGIDLRLPENGLDAVEIACYMADAEELGSLAHLISTELPVLTRLYAGLRPSYPDSASAGELTRKVGSLRAAGVVGSFYNYGLVRQAELDWIGRALRDGEEAPA
jgi:hypothetical protein